MIIAIEWFPYSGKTYAYELVQKIFNDEQVKLAIATGINRVDKRSKWSITNVKKEKQLFSWLELRCLSFRRPRVGLEEEFLDHSWLIGHDSERLLVQLKNVLTMDKIRKQYNYEDWVICLVDADSEMLFDGGTYCGPDIIIHIDVSWDDLKKRIPKTMSKKDREYIKVIFDEYMIKRSAARLSLLNWFVFDNKGTELQRYKQMKELLIYLIQEQYGSEK